MDLLRHGMFPPTLLPNSHNLATSLYLLVSTCCLLTFSFFPPFVMLYFSADALDLGSRLCRKGLIQCVNGDPLTFQVDPSTFYRFGPVLSGPLPTMALRPPVSVGFRFTKVCLNVSPPVYMTMTMILVYRMLTYVLFLLYYLILPLDFSSLQSILSL